MIDKRFMFPDGLVLDDKTITNRLETEVVKILRTKVVVTPVRHQSHGDNIVFYSVRKDGTTISKIWCDPDSRKIQREGIRIYINSGYYEGKIYSAIVEIFGLQDR